MVFVGSSPPSVGVCIKKPDELDLVIDNEVHDGCDNIIGQNVESKMGRQVAEGECEIRFREHGRLLCAGRNVTDEGRVRGLLERTLRARDTPKLDAHGGCQVEQISLANLCADQGSKRHGFTSVVIGCRDLLEPAYR